MAAHKTHNLEVAGSSPASATKFAIYRLYIEHLQCGIAQMAARKTHNLEVAGSSPAPATI